MSDAKDKLLKFWLALLLLLPLVGAGVWLKAWWGRRGSVVEGPNQKITAGTGTAGSLPSQTPEWPALGETRGGPSVRGNVESKAESLPDTSPRESAREKHLRDLQRARDAAYRDQEARQ